MSDIKRIMYMDDDFKAHEFEFRKDIIDKLMNFALDCQHRILELTKCNENEILICIPNYLLDFLRSQHVALVNNSEKPTGDIYLYGMKVQMSYENSVTVFFNAYIPNQIIKFTQQL